jgi:hypothetical protein
MLLGRVVVGLQRLRQDLGGIELQQVGLVVIDAKHGVEQGHGRFSWG